MPDAPAAAMATPLTVLYRHVWRHAEGARLRMTLALSMLGSSQLLKLAMPWMAADAIDTLQLGGAAAPPRSGAWIAAILALQVAMWALHGPAREIERMVALRVRRSVADALYARLAQTRR